MYACMQITCMRTTMAMDSALRDRLMGLKATWHAPSLEAVVQRLVDGSPASALALYRARQTKVDAVLRRHGIRRLIAFGSRARGDARPDSDLDLAAELPPTMSLFDLGGLQADLEDAFGLPVDIVSLRAPRPRLAAAIARDGVTLAGA